MTTAVGFSRPKRFCVPENRNYTAVETKALDELEAACEQAIAELAAAQQLVIDLQAQMILSKMRPLPEAK